MSTNVTIEVDEHTAGVLHARAAERGVSVSVLVAELVTLDNEPVVVESDEIAELDRRWNKIALGQATVPHERIVRWLRTWGTICWRYGLSGSFWWAVDLSDRTDPLSKPIYNPRETRWGNGVLFYSGARLPDIGFPAIDGPLSSLRMKAYRRGLQDYEYCWLLAQKGKRAVADGLIREVIPVALAEAVGAGNRTSVEASEAADRGGQAGRRTASMQTPPWRTDVEAWYRMHEELARALDAK